MNLPKEFHIDHQWNLFLKRMGHVENQMPKNQIREMKFAFYGAWGQLLILLLEAGNSKTSDAEMAAYFRNMADQVSNFMDKAYKEQIDDDLKAAMDWCEKNDKSVEFMIAYMQDFADVDHDTVMNFLRTKGGFKEKK